MSKKCAVQILALKYNETFTNEYRIEFQLRNIITSPGTVDGIPLPLQSMNEFSQFYSINNQTLRKIRQMYDLFGSRIENWFSFT